MSLPEFDYLSPPDMGTACELLREHGEKVAIIAGGTGLVMHLKRRLKQPQYLLSLKNLPELKMLSYDPGSGFTIGAMCTMGKIAADHLIQTKLTSLATAAGKVASPQIRNMATIGGNICLDTRCWYFDRTKFWRKSMGPCFKIGGERCHVIKKSDRCYALFQSDTVASLLALGAQVKLVSHAGERMVPLENIYSGRGEAPHRVSPGELVSQIQIPELPPRSNSAYVKYRMRDSLEFPILGVACTVTKDRDGTSCGGARFGIVGHDSKPHLIDATEWVAGLKEPVLTDHVLDRLMDSIKPVYHMGVSASFKKGIARLLVQEAFLASWPGGHI